VVKISSVLVKGNYYGFVTGYHLMHSEDGIHWHGYKESHAHSWKVTNCHHIAAYHLTGLVLRLKRGTFPI